jgi:hypothetical protein
MESGFPHIRVPGIIVEVDIVKWSQAYGLPESLREDVISYFLREMQDTHAVQNGVVRLIPNPKKNKVPPPDRW